ncbi:MAG: biotin--[acetyl-CoA-carboxylase] ligase, partial [Candidatus Atribacteria bacterium]|nr:biotin--[acetyl-CoA-carboxylase] ligase [Candidatus Atribacteria bacterium]
EEIDSTNRLVRDLARDGSPEGTVVIAREQTEGRGRRGRGWFSLPEKSLVFSLLLRPTSIGPVHCPQIALVSALALSLSLERIGLLPGLKWPNDVLLGGKKTAGILLESSLERNEVNWVIIGVGINVNMEEADFPPMLRGKATSLRIEKGEFVEKEQIITSFFSFFREWYARWRKPGEDRALQEAYTRRLVGKGEPIFLRGTGEVLEGRMEGIDEEGALLVFTKSGLRRFQWGEVSFCAAQKRQ